jgi:cold shock CspA family protein
MTTRFTGTVISANRVKGYSFIMPDENQPDFPFPDRDLYTHVSQVANRLNLRVGQRVSFVIGEREGRVIAALVEPLTQSDVPTTFHPAELGSEPAATSPNITSDGMIATKAIVVPPASKVGR